MASIQVVSAVVRLICEIILEENNRIKKKWKKKLRVRNWIQRRNYLRAQNALIRELTCEDPSEVHHLLRMNETMFRFLLERVKHTMKKKETVMRCALPVKLKLKIALRYLATGDSLASLQNLYRVPKCLISKFLPLVLDAIYSSLKEFIQVPHSESEWNKIMQDFQKTLLYPKCIGVVGGKHVIQSPPNTSLNCKRKGTCSFVILALVDHNYCFTAIDIGSYGSQCDEAVFDHSNFKTALESNTFSTPQGSVIVGDEGFPLKSYLMTPYPRRTDEEHTEKIYNYRHRRARRIIENAFGLLANRFQVFKQHVCLNVETAIEVVKSACVLHNWIRKSNALNDITVDDEDHENGTIIRGSWRNQPPSAGFQNIAPARNHHSSTEAAEIRNQFAQYFVGEGAVPWQENMIS